MKMRWGWGIALSLWALPALARTGGGEHYDSGGGDGGGGGGGGDGDIGFLVYWVLRLTLEYPQVMIPLLLVIAIAWVVHRRATAPTPATRRALQEREAQQRTVVSSRDVETWVGALKRRDPAFELIPLLDKVQKLFGQVQQAWFLRALERVRAFLSDATYQRLNVQERLLGLQGLRDAIADLQVLDLQLVGLDQNPYFDTVHVRIRAQLRDTDVPAASSDAEAEAAAKRAPLEPFTEVWSFVRRPGAQTKIGADLFQGNCPNCGAPYNGGATNVCGFCKAVVNSGNYDWTLAEITQGVEFQRHVAEAPGIGDLRRTDPGLNVQVLEDRASLIFWRWVDAQSRGEAARLAKLALPGFSDQLARAQPRVFLECAVGAVNTLLLAPADGGLERAHVELRWSARMGGAPATLPQRWVFTLARQAGATTVAANGMATFRCPSCNAPLGDGDSPSCEYCGALQNDGGRDWVLESAAPFESWSAGHLQRSAGAILPPPATDAVASREERERLLYMMAALAAADGNVDEREERLLRTCSLRWSVPWPNVEMALRAGPKLFDRLVPKSSPEAEAFLREIVAMALVDGRVDREERRMLESAAQHLGVRDRLDGLLRR